MLASDGTKCGRQAFRRIYHIQRFRRWQFRKIPEMWAKQTATAAHRSVDSHPRPCSFYPRRLGPAHRDSGKPGYASMTRWPRTQSKHERAGTGQTRVGVGRGGAGKVPTCTMLLMTWGSMFNGNLRMLKSESDTKAFSASRMLFSSTDTYTAKVVSATWTDRFGQVTLLERHTWKKVRTPLAASDTRLQCDVC